MEYTVAPYRADLEKSVASLHSGLINQSRGFSRGYLRWKYQENPYISDPLLFLVLRGREVVGMRGMFGTAWYLDSSAEPVVLPHADDLVIRPDHRNRGLFLLLNRAMAAAARNRGYPAVVNLSGGEVTQSLQLAAGWKAVGTLHRFYRLPSVPGESSQGPTSRRGVAGTRAVPFLQRLPGSYRLMRTLHRLGFRPPSLPPEQAVDQILGRMASPGNQRILVSRSPDCAAMASLAEARFPARVRPVRSEAFFRWRLGNPARHYRFLYWHDSRLRGYMVLSWCWRNPERVIIADYAAEEEAVLDELLEALLRSEPTEYWLLSPTLPESHASRFQAAGFTATPPSMPDQRRRFLFYSVSASTGLTPPAGAPRPWPDHWYVSYLDSMGA